jgi:hypothetical protein
VAAIADRRVHLADGRIVRDERGAARTVAAAAEGAEGAGEPEPAAVGAGARG